MAYQLDDKAEPFLYDLEFYNNGNKDYNSNKCNTQLQVVLPADDFLIIGGNTHYKRLMRSWDSDCTTDPIPFILKQKNNNNN